MITERPGRVTAPTKAAPPVKPATSESAAFQPLIPLTLKSSPGAARDLVRHEPPVPMGTKADFATMGARELKKNAPGNEEIIGDWMETKRTPESVYVSGTDAAGKPTVRNGLSHHQEFEEAQNPTPREGQGRLPIAHPNALQRMLAPLDVSAGNTKDPFPERDKTIFSPTYVGSNAPGPSPSEGDGEHWSRNVLEPWMTGFDVINDVNTRLGSLRRWRADDPKTHKDDPVIEYTTPSGKKYTSKENLPYYDVGGTLISGPDIAGLKTTDSDFEYYAPGTPGTEAFPVNEQGYPTRWLGTYTYKGSKIKESDRQYAKLAHLAFPDGTITQNADGSIPDNWKQPYYEQVDHNGWGVRDPRSIFQDKSGRNPWDQGWDYKKPATNEAPEYLLDMGLSSALYMSDPRVAAAVGISQAVPAALGYDVDTLAPKDRDIENLGSIGEGDYSGEKVTRAQSIGHTLSPIIDSAAEHLSGKAIGGIENLMPKFISQSRPGKAFKNFAENTPQGRLVSSFITEGAEEAAVSPADKLAQDSWRNYAREKYWNNQTLQQEYEKKPKMSQRIKNVLGSQAEDFMAGGIMGVGLGGIGEAGKAISQANNIRRGASRGDYLPTPSIPVAPRKSEKSRPADVMTQNREQ